MPPPIVLSAGVPMPPALYVGTLKSADIPEFTPFAPNTLTVHEIASFTRTTVVDALTCPTHDSTDAVVGTPNTPNVNGLPLTAPLLDAKSSVTWNVVVDTLGDVK